MAVAQIGVVEEGDLCPLRDETARAGGRVSPVPDLTENLMG